MIYWTKDGEDRASRQEEKGKTSEKIDRCSEAGHTDGWCDRGGYSEVGWGGQEADDLLWRSLVRGRLHSVVVQTVCAHSRKHNSLWCPRGAAGSSFISTF